VSIIHEVALLRTRVTELESANERLSKRQRLKKKRLQAGGSLSVQEAEDIIGGSSSGSDLGSDLGGNKGREGSDCKPLRRCGNCGEAGHNSRTCQNDWEASSNTSSTILIS